MRAIFSKELRYYFTSMIGFVVLFIFYAISGIIFYFNLTSDSADIQPVMSMMMIAGLVIAPILTMRLISDEKRLKTDQLLLTSPVKLSSIVVGKFFAALVVYTMCIAISFFYALVINAKAEFEWTTFLLTVLGLFLAGAALISLGLLLSATTESQIIALISSFGIMILIFLIGTFSSVIPIAWISKTLEAISFFDRYSSFINGILNISDILFFISVAVIFNFLTVRVLEKKRWS